MGKIDGQKCNLNDVQIEIHQIKFMGTKSHFIIH